MRWERMGWEVLRRERMSGKGSSTTLGEVEVGSAEMGRYERERE
jgi:hypothetical protein